jgi:signal transduction histidine kinase
MNTLRVRLSLAFLVVIGVTIASFAWTMNTIARASFEDYIHQQSGIGAGRGEGRGQGQIRALGVAEETFLSSLSQGIAITGGIGGAIAIIAGIGLAWALSRPLRTLTHAIETVSTGAFGAQIAVNGTTEIQMLTESFNRMSSTLSETEQLRKRMAADIAHELRTPVTVLRGHLEAMLDGVYPMTQERLAVAYDQTLTLGHLVEDLRLLTLAEAKQLSLNLVDTDIKTFITPILESFLPLALDAELNLSWQIETGLPNIPIDPLRMRQVMNNLLSNALRYTPKGGEIRVMVKKYAPCWIRISISNTGHSMTDAELKNAFTPFWRGQLAQKEDKGGSGLGLAITKQLIYLHQGKLQAESFADRLVFYADLPERGCKK